jgi:hypothetical protein
MIKNSLCLTFNSQYLSLSHGYYLLNSALFKQLELKLNTLVLRFGICGCFPQRPLHTFMAWCLHTRSTLHLPSNGKYEFGDGLLH